MIDSTTSTADTSSSSPVSTDTASVASAAPSTTPDTSQSVAPTWDAAFEAAGLTGGPAPDAPPEAAPAPVPATVEPPPDAAAPESQAPLDAKGPIPFDRHTAILENARRKSAEEIVGRVESQFGPAIQLQQRMQTDPIGTLTQLIDEAVAHPEIGQHVVSQLARTLSARRSQKTDLTPIETEVGPVYTASQVEALVAQQIAQRVAPIEQERQARAEEARQTQQREQTRQTVTSRLKHWESRPGFSEHKADIAEAQKAYVSQGIDTWSALGLAYADVYEAKVRPKQQAAQTTQFVQSAVAKAQASTGNPGVVAPSTNRRPTTWDEAFKQVGLSS